MAESTIQMPEYLDGEMRRAAIAVCPKITHHELHKIYRALCDAKPISMGGRGGDSQKLHGSSHS